MSDNPGTQNYVEAAAEIVAAYVSNNAVATSDLAELMREVHTALVSAATEADKPPAPAAKPAVPIRRSVTPDYIICLEDGRKFRSLKRHLRTQYDLTPEQYREKWGLPLDYPMVAPNYAEARSQLAKKMGLGQQRRRRRPAA